jgi:hypothetical protein
MKTDELITVLSTNVEPIDRRQLSREIVAAVILGTVVAIGTALALPGMRMDLGAPNALTYFCAKIIFATVIVIAGTAYLLRLARPGSVSSTHAAPVTWPPLVVAALAAASLVSAPLWHWHTMAMGDRWLECLVSIPLIAVVPFVAVVWAVRRMAPTDLIRTGALAGFVAGGISAAGYALHCTDDSLPFIALWYGGAILMCTLAGALLGPRLLRW